MREFDAQQNGFVATIRGRDSATWQGIGQDVTDLLEVGEDYNFRISAKLLDVANDVTALLKLTLAIEDDSPSIRYPGAIYVEDGLSTEWQTFEGYFGPLEVTGEVSSIRLFAEGPPIGISFAVDDVMVTADLTTSSPTMAPTSPPTQPDFLVSADQNTEQVIIPQPPPADFSPNTARNDCPHLQGTFVDFHSYFGSLSNGQDITIPLDTIMLISRTVPETLGFVTIPATSTLVFGENDDGIAFDVGGIQVEGSLIAGSETCRLQTQLDITLHGNRPLGAQSEEYKGISVTGKIYPACYCKMFVLSFLMQLCRSPPGLLSLHGKRYYRTMTRLARRALPGDTMLYVQDVVNWELDQEIVLVTTAIRDSRDWHENEVFVVDRVETSNMPYPEVKSVVHLTSAVQNGHIGTFHGFHLWLERIFRRLTAFILSRLSIFSQRDRNTKPRLGCSPVSSRFRVPPMIPFLPTHNQRHVSCTITTAMQGTSLATTKSTVQRRTSRGMAAISSSTVEDGDTSKASNSFAWVRPTFSAGIRSTFINLAMVALTATGKIVASMSHSTDAFPSTVLIT